MSFTVIPADSIDRDSYLFEPLGVRGAAEALLRSMVATAQVFAYVSYSPAATSSLKKACKALEDSGLRFTIEKAGKSHREVTIVRKAANGKKGFEFTRTYLNTELLSIENLNIDSDES